MSTGFGSQLIGGPAAAASVEPGDRWQKAAVKGEERVTRAGPETPSLNLVSITAQMLTILGKYLKHSRFS